jgi:hypothetical protein
MNFGELQTPADKALYREVLGQRYWPCDSPLRILDEGEGTSFWLSQVAIRRVIWFEWIE